MNPLIQLKAAILPLLITFMPGVIVLAQAPPNTTIPRVPNPPLSSDLTNLPGDLRGFRCRARRRRI
jgi:hypothetical protein